MKSTAQKLILLSFILAVTAAVVVFLYLQSLNTPKQVIKKTTVLVAAETIPARTLIDQKMINEIEVTDAALFTDYLKSSSDIIGKYTKETILKNEGFHKDKLLDKNSDELSIKLNKDFRAVSINATGASGVSDLLKPGDFVDIIVYLKEVNESDKAAQTDIAKMIMQNIEVLAIDKQLAREEKTAADEDKSVSSFLITLAVKTTDIEKLTLAENIGSLKLALRPIKDTGTADTDGTTPPELLLNAGSNNNSSGGTNSSNISTGSTNNSSKYLSYTVQRGDTLKNISLNFYGDESKYPIIKEANGINDANIIITGEVIKIPLLGQ